MTNIRMTLLAMTAVFVLVAACSGASTAPSPAASQTAPPSASPSASPTAGPVTTPEGAIARVILTEKRLTGIAPLDPDAIGQASWYEIAQGSGVGAFVVTVRVGWGDCEAGCIDEHRWVYAVAPDGAVSIVSETGAPVPDGAWPGAAPAAGRTGIGGTATAGPICPVETVPPDPACAARPVAGAVIVIRDASGTQVHRVTTGADGTFFAELPPGGYVVEPQPAKGLMGTPAAQNVTVSEGAVSTIELGYDTGIR